jgi:hypothetical protein
MDRLTKELSGLMPESTPVPTRKSPFDALPGICYNLIHWARTINQHDTGREQATMEEIEITPTEETQIGAAAPEPQGGLSRRQIIGISVVAVVVLALIVAAGYGMVTHPLLTSVIRDIAIIVLALITIVIGAFLAILIFQLQSLTALLRDEIKPILDSANETANTVRGTTVFVSDAVVTPMITAASYVSAIRQTLKVLTGGPSRKRPTKTNANTSDQPQQTVKE